jgi:hypothetical protein
MALCILLHYKHVLDLALPLYLTESKNRMQFGKAKAHLMISPIGIVAFPFSGQSASFSRRILPETRQKHSAMFTSPQRQIAPPFCLLSWEHISQCTVPTGTMPILLESVFKNSKYNKFGGLYRVALFLTIQPIHDKFDQNSDLAESEFCPSAEFLNVRNQIH